MTEMSGGTTHPRLSTPRAPVPAHRLLVAIAAVALAVIASSGVAEGSGTGAFNVNNATMKLAVSYNGVCQPGTLSTGISSSEAISTSAPRFITVGGDTFGCIGVDSGPGTVLIEGATASDRELFRFTSVHTATSAGVTSTQTTPFKLNVLSTANFNAPTGFLYIDAEYFQYNQGSVASECSGLSTSTQFCITARAQMRPGLQPTTQTSHTSGAFVQAQGELKLVARAQPTAVSLSDGMARTHNSGVIVRDPTTHLTCRARFAQTKVVAGNDIVTARARCYMRLEPGAAWPDASYSAWPADPSTGPVQPLTPILYHGTSAGTITDAAGSPATLTVDTEVFGLSCFPLVQGHLWVKITQVIFVDSTPHSGTFRIALYRTDDCTGTPDGILGGNDGMNLTATEIAATTDTDKDGCTDSLELGPTAGGGGLRDPFNPFDYFDANHDGAVAVGADILAVAGAFGNTSGPRYSPFKDRQAFPGGAGPSQWNKMGPDGSVAVGADILTMAGQFGHACSVGHTHSASAFGAHPTALSAKVSSAQGVPFAMNVASTASFPKSGQLLINDETFTYNQNGACGHTPENQFCVTARGGSSQHLATSAVLPK